jgi:hypothetical protein
MQTGQMRLIQRDNSWKLKWRIHTLSNEAQRIMKIKTHHTPQDRKILSKTHIAHSTSLFQQICTERNRHPISRRPLKAPSLSWQKRTLYLSFRNWIDISMWPSPRMMPAYAFLPCMYSCVAIESGNSCAAVSFSKHSNKPLDYQRRS